MTTINGIQIQNKIGSDFYANYNIGELDGYDCNQFINAYDKNNEQSDYTKTNLVGSLYKNTALTSNGLKTNFVNHNGKLNIKV